MGLQEFQAVVLAGGKGTRLSEIIEGRPKCLLPIGPYPMIWYPLQLLQRHGFNDVLVIVQESEKSEIQQRLDRLQLKLKLDYCCISSDSDCGTADSLRFISDKLKSDLVVMSCDTVVEVDLYRLLSKFREQDASIQMLLVEGDQDLDVAIPGPKSKSKAEKDFIGYDEASGRVLFMASASDFEESVELPGHLLRAYPLLRFSSGLLDSHIYVMKKWVMEYLAVSDFLSALKGELLPHVIKKQLLPAPVVQEGEAASEFIVNVKNDDIFNYAVYTELDAKIDKASNFNRQKDSHPIRCYAHLSDETSFGMRVNNVRSFLACNLKIFEHFSALTGLSDRELVSQTCSIKSTQISKCAVGEMTNISEKTSLNSNVISNGCTIQAKTRINNSVLMDGVTVKENVVVENCIIGEKAIVECGSVLKNCLVGPHFIVVANTKTENVYLSNADGFMTID